MRSARVRLSFLLRWVDGEFPRVLGAKHLLDWAVALLRAASLSRSRARSGVTVEELHVHARPLDVMQQVPRQRAVDRHAVVLELLPPDREHDDHVVQRRLIEFSMEHRFAVKLGGQPVGETFGRSDNQNLVVFHDTAWPYNACGETLALTTVTYHLDTGELWDVDIEVNTSCGHKITTTEPVPPDGWDLQSIFQHETGHFLGLAHSSRLEEKLTEASMEHRLGEPS